MKNKLLSILVTALILFNSSGASALAISIPSAPATPLAPAAPSAPSAPPAPTPPNNGPEAPAVPTPPPAPTAPAVSTPVPAATPKSPATPKPTATPVPLKATASPVAEVDSETSALASTPLSSPASSPSNVTADSNTGTDNSITTGDATNSATIETEGNNNTSATTGNAPGGVTVVNSENGTDSTNTGSVTVDNSTDTTQNNSAVVVNNLNQDSTTGNNSASRNTGGDNSITTGDANTTGTLITSINTNTAGLMVSEFNIVDDHVGDYVLDFEANCISGCGIGDTSVLNSGNGSDSVNTVDLNLIANNNTFQNNDASIENNLILNADSGHNDASRNTGGNSDITTGDANVAANVINMANNNIAGNVIYGVVNIFGDLIGNILLPEGAVGIAGCCGTDVNLANKNNGSDSTNTINYDASLADNYVQFNELTLDNMLYMDANTGDNQTSRNTSGNNTIATGDSRIDAQVLNVANNNIVGGDWWLVIVNEAGNWVGKILGAPAGSFFGGSEGLAMTADQNGMVNVANNGNGDNTTNTVNVDHQQNNNVTQMNNANIQNNIQLTANTGENDASRNTGGSSNINTGDANIIANIVNFANNNITGGGRLFVTVVNVFGSWLGDFVSPGTEATAQENNNSNDNHALGGVSNQQSSSNDSSNSNNESLNTTSTPATLPNNNIALATQKLNSSKPGVLAAASVPTDSEVDSGIIPTVNAFTGDTSEAFAKDTVKVNLAWFLPIGLASIIGILIVKKLRHA